MAVSTENSTEKSLQQVSENKPISVYSANFTKVINNFAGKRFVPKRRTGADGVVEPRSFSKKVFSWRNAAAMAAILAIGVFHFVFQMSFIRSEVSENYPLIQVPPVKVEPLRTAPVEAEPSDFKIKKTAAELPPKPARTVRQQQQPEPAPLKAQPKKAVESRAERLRRAERILTGI
jgi:hypothetical protein